MQSTATWVIAGVMLSLFIATGLAAADAPPVRPPMPTTTRPVSAADAPTLYVVGYAHLDTQWRWSYPQVIREFLAKTLHDNFALADRYPEYVFNFSGANRYRMMKEYYPAEYERLKRYVADGRWFPCGSSVEESDVNVPSAESLVRQVLYGNEFFRREFKTASAEYMLPDCFGFPASLPSILAHCGIRGFSTQKLTWGSAVGIPFNVGVWEGLDGTSVIAALNAGDYTGRITENLAVSPQWTKRLQADLERGGTAWDYSYYGTGDVGGSPTEDSVRFLQKSVQTKGPIRVISARADQMFLDISDEQRAKLPRYRGDLLLTEHSAGSLSSAAFMKKANRRNETLADAAERAALAAEWLGGAAYPRERLTNAWTLVLGGQFHDILPGTSLPQCYQYSWNDEFIAMGQFAHVLESSVSTVAAGLDTRGEGVPIVVYNPLSVEREDVVAARVRFPAGRPKALRVFGPDGNEVAAQLGVTKDGADEVLFLARVPSTGYAVFDVRATDTESPPNQALSIALDKSAEGSAKTPTTESASGAGATLENRCYRVTVNAAGDVASVYDKRAGRELLRAPIRLAFLNENPAQWPAWNMDWSDRQKPPRTHLAGPVRMRVVEKGPARVALEVERTGEGSRFVQQIRLSAGDAAERIEFSDAVEWQSRACSLKAVFPLAVSNERATYNWEVGTIERGNNDPKKYEVPTHQWMDLTDAKGEYGVSILTDVKYGSDKPDAQTLRLTLLYTPGTRGGYQDQGTQDWGRHSIRYGLLGHEGDWRRGRAQWHALRLNQPLVAFQTGGHGGKLGKRFALAMPADDRVRVMAMKKAEQSDEWIVRVVELEGRWLENARIAFAAPVVSAREVDGQERPLGEARVENGSLTFSLPAYRLKSFAVRLAPPGWKAPAGTQAAVKLAFDRRAATRDGEATPQGQGLDSAGRCMPAAMLPAAVEYGGVQFALGNASEPNAITCRGQTVALPSGEFNRLWLLAAAEGDQKIALRAGDKSLEATVHDWSGFVGQWDNRVWKGKVRDMTFDWPNELDGLEPGFAKNAPLAWYCSHRHDAKGGNQPYEYSYLFAYSFALPPGTASIQLPDDPRVFVFAATVANDATSPLSAAQPLVEEFSPPGELVATIVPDHGEFNDCTTVRIDPPLYGARRTVRYTQDGSEPTAESPAYAGPFLLHADTRIKVRVFDGATPAGPTIEADLRVRDVTPPRVLDALAVAGCPEAYLWFSEPLHAESAATAAYYQLGGGVEVAAARVDADGRGVALTLRQPMPDGDELALTIDGVLDRAPVGNRVDKASVRPLRPLRPSLTLPGGRFDRGPKQTIEGALSDSSMLAPDHPWTINVWVRIERMLDDYTVIAGFGSVQDRAGTQRYLCRFPQGLHFWGSGVDVSTGTEIRSNQWEMLTASFDGKSVAVYLDGRLLRSAEITLNPVAGVVKLAPLGPWGHSRPFGGEIRAFSLWPAALPAQTVAWLYRQGADRPTSQASR